MVHAHAFLITSIDGFFMGAGTSAHIILGVSGSIAAYKSPFILRALQKRGLTVNVVLTPSATEFVSPLVLANLSKKPVVVQMFDTQTQRDGSWHIHMARKAQAMLVAPASAKTLASLAYGLCDTALSCVALALPPQTPLIVAPAMDTEMWEHPATKHNVELLRSRGVHIIEPEFGELASGLIGPGRLAEIETIVSQVFNLVQPRSNPTGDSLSSRTLADEPSADIVSRAAETSTRSLEDAVQRDAFHAELELELLKKSQGLSTFRSKKFVVTAGPTRERVDDVRYVSNYSSGKMGFALAEAAAQSGAEVVLISGPVLLPTPPGVVRIDVESSQQMFEAVKQYSSAYDCLFMCAAVADYRPDPVANKIKKSEMGSTWQIELHATPDILAWLGANKLPHQTVVGFALESQNEVQYGAEKLQRKNCDMIVVNSSNPSHSAIGADDNQVQLLWIANGMLQQRQLPRLPKLTCAQRILDHLQFIQGS